jgi:LytR cell envelope-related transcriptional attenuator
MEHSLPPLELGRLWRTTAIVVSAVALLELVALVAAGIALLGEPAAERVRNAAREAVLATPAKPKPLPPPVANEPLPTLPRSDTSVLVLNGNGRTGAASTTAARILGIGYIVAGAANAPRSDYRRSIVMYRPGRQIEAARLAKDLRVKVVGPLDGLRPKQLMGAHVALIIGS